MNKKWILLCIVGGILMIIAGFLALQGMFVDLGGCSPVHLFFLVTLPLLVAGTLFLLSRREARKHPYSS